MSEEQQVFFTDALEGVDAAVFTGDSLHDPELLAKFEEYLARWQRSVAAHKAAHEPKITCAVSGVVKWGNRLGACLHHGQDDQCYYAAHCEHKVVPE